jgi:hypothetical protein
MKFPVLPVYRWGDIIRRIRTLYDGRRLRRRREIFPINLVTFAILTTTNDISKTLGNPIPHIDKMLKGKIFNQGFTSLLLTPDLID